MGGPTDKPPVAEKPKAETPDKGFERNAKRVAEYKKSSRAEGVVAREAQPSLVRVRMAAGRTMDHANQAGRDAQRMNPDQVGRDVTRKILVFPASPQSKSSEEPAQKGALTSTGAKATGKVVGAEVAVGRQGQVASVTVTEEAVSVGVSHKKGAGSEVVAEAGGDTGAVRIMMPEGSDPNVEADYNLPGGASLTMNIGPTGDGSVTLFLPAGFELGAEGNVRTGEPGEEVEIAYAPKVTIPGFGTGNLRVSSSVGPNGKPGPVNISFGAAF